MNKFYLMIFSVVTLVGMIVISGCKKKETYTVTFNANGGTGTMTAQTFTEGEAQALTHNTFTYEGHTFASWNTVQDGSGVSYTDGQAITVTADMTLFAQWTSNGTNPTPGPDPTPTPPNTLNGHEFVDLGLPSGLLWATCNVGATTPEGYGDYFAWGETTSKGTYTYETYIYAEGTSWDNPQLTKYCSEPSVGSNGYTDELTTLEACDDAATVNWGEGWRMPTINELNELYNNCTREWTVQNGINGEKFTGSNGKSIFLPAAGGRYDSELDYVGSDSYYWSSSLFYGSSNYAWVLFFHLSDLCDTRGNYRCNGYSVRAVCQSQN